MSLPARSLPKALTSVLLASASLIQASPAHADQFVEAADGATIDCVLARGALTRIALIKDGFANVSKMASGYPYNDFEVTHEPVRGDIYISVPQQYASARVSFFATSSKGHVCSGKRSVWLARYDRLRFALDHRLGYQDRGNSRHSYSAMPVPQPRGFRFFGAWLMCPLR